MGDKYQYIWEYAFREIATFKGKESMEAIS
jgi:hypothetical protein